MSANAIESDSARPDVVLPMRGMSGKLRLGVVRDSYPAAIGVLQRLFGDSAVRRPGIYTVRVTVTSTAVVATLDGEPLCATRLPSTTLSLRPEVLLSRPLGIASFATAAAIHSVRWRPLGP